MGRPHNEDMELRFYGFGALVDLVGLSLLAVWSFGLAYTACGLVSRFDVKSCRCRICIADNYMLELIVNDIMYCCFGLVLSCFCLRSPAFLAALPFMHPVATLWDRALQWFLPTPLIEARFRIYRSI
jgi:hypothetical protein